MQRLGVMIAGVNGAVATTTTAGVLAHRSASVPLAGLVTGAPEFEGLGLIDPRALVFGGWDLRAGCHLEWMRRHALVPSTLLEQIEKDARAVPVLGAPRCGVTERILQLPGSEPRPPETRAQAARRLIDDITALREDAEACGVVVVNLSSTEPPPPPSPSLESLEAFERGLERDDPAIRPGMLYAYAALATRSPYVNFTPSVNASVPALLELAQRNGVALAGRDGKTGQTLLKTVIAPMLRARALRVRGWYSVNLLGNADGFVLQDPEHAAPKIASKANVLSSILGYDDFDHQVHIHYYGPRGDAKEAWDTIDFSGWLDVPLQLKLNWLGHDSLLAAPLVVDLIRLIWLGQQRGEAGFAPQLASFFKSPQGTAVHDFAEQMRALRDYAAAVRRESASS